MGDFDFRNRCPKTRKLAIDMPIFLCVIAHSIRAGLALSEVHSAAGSPIWQLVFISFAIILILFEVLRGWRRGIARQVARLGALVAAYFAGFFGGNLVFPLMRPFFKMPDIVLSTLAGAALALIVYAIINGLGTIFFRRTSQHNSVLVRLWSALDRLAQWRTRKCESNPLQQVPARPKQFTRLTCGAVF
jgi:hypothetical protein